MASPSLSNSRGHRSTLAERTRAHALTLGAARNPVNAVGQKVPDLRRDWAERFAGTADTHGRVGRCRYLICSAFDRRLMTLQDLYVMVAMRGPIGLLRRLGLPAVRTTRVKLANFLKLAHRYQVRAQHAWKYMRFETRVTLAAGRPYVEVVSRVFTKVPPHSDASPPDIKAGYWMSFTPAFQVSRVLRDYPLAIDATTKKAVHALTFADFLGKDTGLLVLHPGTQWFSRDENGAISNLLMREWESHFTREYGWPLYAEYRHAILPHDGKLSNADRLQASAGFAQPLIAHVGPFQTGELPASKGFVTVTPAAVQLSALRKKAGKGMEIRVVEVDGKQSPTTVELGFPVADACETNLLGAKVAEVKHDGNKLRFTVDPWKIRTFEINS